MLVYWIVVPSCIQSFMTQGAISSSVNINVHKKTVVACLSQSHWWTVRCGASCLSTWRSPQPFWSTRPDYECVIHAIEPAAELVGSPITGLQLKGPTKQLAMVQWQIHLFIKWAVETQIWESQNTVQVCELPTQTLECMPKWYCGEEMDNVGGKKGVFRCHLECDQQLGEFFWDCYVEWRVT
jgi:hypothetical protein